MLLELTLFHRKNITRKGKSPALHSELVGKGSIKNEMTNQNKKWSLPFYSAVLKEKCLVIWEYKGNLNLWLRVETVSVVLKKKYQHVTLTWHLQFRTVNRKTYYIRECDALQRARVGPREKSNASEACALIIQSAEELPCLPCNVNQMFHSIKTFLLTQIFRSLVTRRKRTAAT